MKHAGKSAFSGCSSLVDVGFGSTEAVRYARQGSGWAIAGNDALFSAGWACMSTGVQDTIASGSCGTGVTWTLYDNGVLAIIGSGSIEFDQAPWSGYVQQTTAITIDNGVTGICASAFQGLSMVNHVTLPASVTSIGQNAFDGCANLRNVCYGGGLTDRYSREGAKWKGSGNIDLFTSTWDYASIPQITSSGKLGAGNDALKWALYDNGLLAVSGYDDMPNYNSNIFWTGSESIRDVVLETGVTSIGASAFSGCVGLVTVKIPVTVTAIGASAFEECICLFSVNLPSGLRSIGAEAFQSCFILPNVSIPAGVTSIGDGAFAGCEALTNFYVASGSQYFTAVNGVLFDKAGTTLVLFPTGRSGSCQIPNVTAIGANAFLECYNLTSVTFPNGLTSIGANAFENCFGLTAVEFPSGLTGLGAGAFKNCAELASVKLQLSLTSIGANAFLDCYSLSAVEFAGTERQMLQRKGSGWSTAGNDKLFGATWTCTGTELHGWQTIDGKKYYYDANGDPVTGLQTIDGKKYFFDANGAMQTGWQTIGSARCYFGTDGVMKTGWQEIGSRWYYLESSGEMVTGWKQISGKWYYFETSGEMVTGRKQISGKWYYFEDSGAMLANTSRKIGKKTYKFDPSGVCTNP